MRRFIPNRKSLCRFYEHIVGTTQLNLFDYRYKIRIFLFLTQLYDVTVKSYKFESIQYTNESSSLHHTHPNKSSLSPTTNTDSKDPKPPSSAIETTFYPHLRYSCTSGMQTARFRNGAACAFIARSSHNIRTGFHGLLPPTRTPSSTTCHRMLPTSGVRGLMCVQG